MNRLLNIALSKATVERQSKKHRVSFSAIEPPRDRGTHLACVGPEEAKKDTTGPRRKADYRRGSTLPLLSRAGSL